MDDEHPDPNMPPNHNLPVTNTAPQTEDDMFWAEQMQYGQNLPGTHNGYAVQQFGHPSGNNAPQSHQSNQIGFQPQNMGTSFYSQNYELASSHPQNNHYPHNHPSTHHANTQMSQSDYLALENQQQIAGFQQANYAPHPSFQSTNWTTFPDHTNQGVPQQHYMGPNPQAYQANCVPYNQNQYSMQQAAYAANPQHFGSQIDHRQIRYRNPNINRQIPRQYLNRAGMRICGRHTRTPNNSIATTPAPQGQYYQQQAGTGMLPGNVSAQPTAFSGQMLEMGTTQQHNQEYFTYAPNNMHMQIQQPQSGLSNWTPFHSFSAQSSSNHSTNVQQGSAPAHSTNVQQGSAPNHSTNVQQGNAPNHSTNVQQGNAPNHSTNVQQGSALANSTNVKQESAPAKATNVKQESTPAKSIKKKNEGGALSGNKKPSKKPSKSKSEKPLRQITDQDWKKAFRLPSETRAALNRSHQIADIISDQDLAKLPPQNLSKTKVVASCKASSYTRISQSSAVSKLRAGNQAGSRRATFPSYVPPKPVRRSSSQVERSHVNKKRKIGAASPEPYQKEQIQETAVSYENNIANEILAELNSGEAKACEASDVVSDTTGMTHNNESAPRTNSITPNKQNVIVITDIDVAVPTSTVQQNGTQSVNNAVNVVAATNVLNMDPSLPDYNPFLVDTTKLNSSEERDAALQRSLAAAFAANPTCGPSLSYRPSKMNTLAEFPKRLTGAPKSLMAQAESSGCEHNTDHPALMAQSLEVLDLTDDVETAPEMSTSVATGPPSGEVATNDTELDTGDQEDGLKAIASIETPSAENMKLSLNIFADSNTDINHNNEFWAADEILLALGYREISVFGPTDKHNDSTGSIEEIPSSPNTGEGSNQTVPDWNLPDDLDEYMRVTRKEAREHGLLDGVPEPNEPNEFDLFWEAEARDAEAQNAEAQDTEAQDTKARDPQEDLLQEFLFPLF